jgi:hypothetical protein
MTATPSLIGGSTGLVAGGLRIVYPERDMRRGLRTFLDVKDPKTGAKRRIQFHRWPRGKANRLLIHSTGPGMSKYARIHELTNEETVARVYGNPGNSCAHVCVLPDGARIRTTPYDLVAPHCGASSVQRQRMLDGSWRAWTSDDAEEQWAKLWPGVKSPQHLFPTASANDSCEGLETWKGDAIDPETGTRYTMAQYRSTAQWVVQRERALGFLADGVRLLTHEAVQPFERWDDVGGHDPGVMRPVPLYNWPLLRECIAAERAIEAAP